MNTPDLTSLIFRIVITAVITFYCYKIARMVVTPTNTWIILGIGFLLALVRLISSFFPDFPIPNGILSAISSIAILIGIVKIYYDTKEKFKGKIPDSRL